MKIFVILSCNTLLINNCRKGFQDLFEIKKEILVFDSLNYLIEILSCLKK